MGIMFVFLLMVKLEVAKPIRMCYTFFLFYLFIYYSVLLYISFYIFILIYYIYIYLFIFYNDINSMEGGEDEETMGMIPRAVHQIFIASEDFKKKGWVYDIDCQVSI